MPWESLFPSSHPLEAWVPASRLVGALPLARSRLGFSAANFGKVEEKSSGKQDLWKIFFVDTLPIVRGGD